MPDWNERYATAPAGLFGTAPNEYVREAIARSDITPACALMIADGDGRNGRWLAAQGVAITAIDISAVATRHALALDAAAGVTVDRIVADVETWPPQPGVTWDAAFVVYIQGPRRLRDAAVSVAWSALKPGGHFVLEGFCADPVSPTLPDTPLGPSRPEHRHAMDDLLQALGPTAEIIEALTGIVRLKEGDGHDGCGRVIRLIARKRADDAPTA